MLFRSLVDGVDIEKNHEGNQAKDRIRNLHSEQRRLSLRERGQGKGNQSPGKKQHNKNRVGPNPPIPPLYLAKVLDEFPVTGAVESQI